MSKGALAGRTALVTGASAGIGAACARALAGAGARVALCARRVERVAALAAELRASGAEAHAFALDVRDAAAVSAALAALPAPFAALDLLVNNAGLSRGLEPLHEGSLDDWDEMLDTNVKGLLYVTRAAVPGMVARGRGHVINVGSIAGRETYPKGAVYCASKHAVDAITRGLRMDLLGTGVRVSTVDPGLVNTEFGTVRFHGDRARADAAYQGMRPLAAEDVAETVLWIASQPPHRVIAEVLLFPADQASARDVHRRS
jgi:3-hydroxy acid dehydrogenase/malonic semialdehyde reductase